MADDKLKQELLYMVLLASKYDFTKMEVVEEILRLENERQILTSVFGKRFKGRIFDIAAGTEFESTCVICGQHAENNVICQHCIDTIGGSEYALNKVKPTTFKDKIKTELKKDVIKVKGVFKQFDKSQTRDFSQNNESSQTGKNSKTISNKIKKSLQFALIGCLSLILIFQLWIFAMFISIPDFNPSEKVRNSSFEIVPVSSSEEAYNQLLLDFPEEDGYTITFAREDMEYSGRFLLNQGDCCIEIEDSLTDEERYDYYFQEPVYVFYVSYLFEHTAKTGIAEVNMDGAILIEGSFNDGRRTDSFYKFR